jgi:Zn-dependent peptidase ImmA (M78 family)
MGDYYVRLVEQAESAGVLVMRNSIVGNNRYRPLDPTEFQGFAMSDELAPLVFVNQKDYLAAQIFTLMHELTHIWMGISGVSLQDYLERPIVQNELTQRRANEIAAETLVPSKDFVLRWRSYDDIDRGLEALQRYYRVSIFVILRRAFELGEISFEFYRSQYDELRSGITPKKKGGGGGYRTLFSRNSTTITTSLLHSVSEGKTLPTQASTLLNVRPTIIYKMQDYLAES